MNYLESFYKVSKFINELITIEKNPANHSQKNIKDISVQVFIPDFNLLSCDFDNFTFKLLY